MLSAFANTLKVPELRASIIFTLIVIIVVRIGAQITTPGVNAAVLHEWFRNQVDNQSERLGGGAVQHLQRRRAGKLRDFLVGHHALHQRVDHDAAHGRGDPELVQDPA